MKKLILFLLIVPIACFSQSKKEKAKTESQLHDILVYIQETTTANEAYKELAKECYTKRVEFATDSFAFYTVCPVTADKLYAHVKRASKKLIK